MRENLHKSNTPCKLAERDMTVRRFRWNQHLDRNHRLCKTPHQYGITDRLANPTGPLRSFQNAMKRSCNLEHRFWSILIHLICMIRVDFVMRVQQLRYYLPTIEHRIGTSKSLDSSILILLCSFADCLELTRTLQSARNEYPPWQVTH